MKTLQLVGQLSRIARSKSLDRVPELMAGEQQLPFLLALLRDLPEFRRDRERRPHDDHDEHDVKVSEAALRLERRVPGSTPGAPLNPTH